MRKERAGEKAEKDGMDEVESIREKSGTLRDEKQTL